MIMAANSDKTCFQKTVLSLLSACGVVMRPRNKK